MEYLTQSLDRPEANLELDESLLEEIDRSEPTQVPREVLRVWESRVPCIVLGKSSRESEEVSRDAREMGGIRVLRRSSGGGTVLLGPGCLVFSLVLSLTLRPLLRDVRESFWLLLEPLARALPLPNVAFAGQSDLTWRGRKFSGNAQRRGRNYLLHHGTLLYDAPIGEFSALLTEPVRRPAYRGARNHAEFLTNVPLTREQLERAVQRAFGVGN